MACNLGSSFVPTGGGGVHDMAKRQRSDHRGEAAAGSINAWCWTTGRGGAASARWTSTPSTLTPSGRRASRTRMETLHGRSLLVLRGPRHQDRRHGTELTICPWPSSRGGHGKPLLASVGGMLLALVYPCFDVLGAPPPPFVTSRVRCSAVHPDGRTLFVSAESVTAPGPPK